MTKISTWTKLMIIYELRFFLIIKEKVQELRHSMNECSHRANVLWTFERENRLRLGSLWFFDEEYRKKARSYLLINLSTYLQYNDVLAQSKVNLVSGGMVVI